MSTVDISNFRPIGENAEDKLNAIFDLCLPDGTYLCDVGISDDGTWIEFSGITDETPWRDEIIAKAELAMKRHRRDCKNAVSVTRLITPRPRGS